MIHNNPNTSVAVIGSFRRHFDDVLAACESFASAGLVINTPLGKSIVDENQEFVRFENDKVDYSDAMVQSVTMERIFRSDFVYVVATQGYVGRTTCYEIGRIIQANIPIYFSQLANDLPIQIHEDFVVTSNDICSRVSLGKFFPKPLFPSASCRLSEIEMSLVRMNREF